MGDFDLGFGAAANQAALRVLSCGGVTLDSLEGCPKRILKTRSSFAGVHMRVLLGEQSALLPDLEAIEGMVVERFAAVG
ncbi:hypothetical protein ACP93_19530 [Xanthomonas sp. NCPPB 1128]|nr:hypothetical protein ACP93_19530 [Xanthomonas sp. NCPPB 1128]